MSEDSDNHLEDTGDGSDQVMALVNPRRSVAWKYFTAVTKDNTNYGCCNACKELLKTGHGTTSPLFNHLEHLHPALWIKCQAQKQKRKKPSADESTTPKKRRGEIPKEKKEKIDELITQMIALDIQPYSCVSDLGLKNLVEFLAPDYDIPCSTTFSRSRMPELYKKLKAEMIETIQSDIVQGIKAICYTSDGWTSRHGDSFLSLTVHYVSKKFEKRDFTLAMRQLCVDHTAENLQDALEEMASEWPLAELSDVPVYIVTDNAPNIAKAVYLTGWIRVHCFGHVQNLALKDAKKVTDGLEDLLKKVRRIVTHFHHSAPAKRALESAQTECNIAVPLALVQMVETRWNSELAMVKRVVQLKKPLSQVLAATRKVKSLTCEEWDTLQELVRVLEPLNQATVISSATSYPTLSMVIPLVYGMNHQLTKIKEKLTEKVSSQLTNNLLESIKERFPEVEKDFYQKATYLDPRYKAFFFEQETVQDVQEALIDEICEDLEQDRVSRSQSFCTQSSEHSTGSEANREDFFSFMRTKDTPDASEKSDMVAQIRNEMRSYLSGGIASHKACPLEWWKNNCDKYPQLSGMAQRYLSLASNSTESERLFSTAGDIAEAKRANLLPENVEILTFVNKNLRGLKKV